MKNNNYWSLGIIVIMGILLVAGCIKDDSLKIDDIQEKEISIIEVTVSELLNDPQTYLNKTIQTQGTLKFLGKNYFAPKFEDFILEDNGTIPVSVWVPLEVPPPMPGGSGDQPLVMSDYLNKKVILKGILRTELDHYIIGVQDAVIIS